MEYSNAMLVDRISSGRYLQEAPSNISGQDYAIFDTGPHPDFTTATSRELLQTADAQQSSNQGNVSMNLVDESSISRELLQTADAQQSSNQGNVSMNLVDESSIGSCTSNDTSVLPAQATDVVTTPSVSAVDIEALLNDVANERNQNQRMREELYYFEQLWQQCKFGHECE